MAFYVYILKCNDGSYYTGHTDDLESRLGEHFAAQNECYTKSRLPLTLMFVQEFATRSEAIETEVSIKKWTRKKKEALIAGDWLLLRQLSRRRGGRDKPFNGK